MALAEQLEKIYIPIKYRKHICDQKLFFYFDISHKKIKAYLYGHVLLMFSGVLLNTCLSDNWDLKIFGCLLKAELNEQMDTFLKDGFNLPKSNWMKI